MPEQETLKRAREDKREGKAPSTQAGEFVREEIHHVREGKHGATSTKQAIAIGLSKARRAGVELPPQPESARTKTKRSTPKRERRSVASRKALASQARSAARRRSPSTRRAAARKAAQTRRRRSGS
jgi:hypothetical protein